MYEEREGLIQPGESMQELKGKSVFGGIAIGRISVYNKDESTVKRVKIEDTAAEVKRFEEAKETAKEQLQALYEKALVEVGEVNAMIFDVHQMMLDDLDYVEAITHMIENQGINAEYAVATTGDNFSNMFAAMDDDYMKARAADVKDISNRVVKILQGKKDSVLDGDEPVILLADDLAPSETVQLDKSKVLAFVTRHGSTNSHTAILARTMNIPALIGVKFEENVDGKFAIVDGYNGNVYVEPTDDVVKEYESKKQEAEEKKRLLQELKGKENITLDGKIYKESGDKRELKYRDMSEFVKEELIPYVENKYRTYGDKEHRAMAGLSMGSLQTSITAFEHSELFSYVGVFSGFVQDILTQNQSHLTEKNKESFRENNKLFFRGIGAEDRFIDFFKSDDEFLEKSKIKCERKIYKGDHEWKVWRRCLYDFAQLIFREDN